MNLPNRITVLRILMIPLFMFFLLGPIPGGEYWAAFFFLLASITDALDGYLARSRGLVSKLGQLLDPLADKILVSSALISMVQAGMVPAWVAVVIVGRELAVTGVRTIAADQGDVIAASWMGKVKTITQVVAISLLMLHDFPFAGLGIPIGEIALYVALAATVLSGLDYFYAARRHFR